MKVLIDINEDRMKDLPYIGGKILGTEKDMTLGTVFTAEDVWNLIAKQPNDDFFELRPFSEEKLLNIESYGRKEFLETVISRITHGFDAEDGVTWYTIRSAAEVAYNDLGLDMEKLAVVDHVSIDGLRTALQRYDENGKSGECGPWEIHDGGNDRWWEISHEGKVVAACYASGEHEKINGKLAELGNIERERHLADKSFVNICKIVSEEFQECRMAPEEQKKINEKNQSACR